MSAWRKRMRTETCGIVMPANNSQNRPERTKRHWKKQKTDGPKHASKTYFLKESCQFPSARNLSNTTKQSAPQEISKR
ncbi:hypothetical protein E1B28_011356 [Marasmius oreades]|uniref:Uncharacterized protein n=1 Tax=Marasmius oreades TaxID=181124 RepID=A0A9P7UR44_9AGAR|nr:uncharacterized protein E1B28_011356 [Marasmius oreades]KAG7089701.1 hypothetical protein E1B28_011356 [Marasmius oreades]